MRVQLKANTVERIEELSKEKMTTRCDKVINKALDAAMKNDSTENQKDAQADCLCPNTKQELEKIG